MAGYVSFGSDWTRKRFSDAYTTFSGLDAKSGLGSSIGAATSLSGSTPSIPKVPRLSFARYGDKTKSDEEERETKGVLKGAALAAKSVVVTGGGHVRKPSEIRESNVGILERGKGRKGDRDAGDIKQLNIQAIIDGSTCRPIAFADLKRYLRFRAVAEQSKPSEERDQWILGARVALDFLLAFREYTERFVQLSPSEKKASPHPFQIVSEILEARPSSFSGPSKTTNDAVASFLSTRDALPLSAFNTLPRGNLATEEKVDPDPVEVPDFDRLWARVEKSLPPTPLGTATTELAKRPPTPPLPAIKTANPLDPVDPVRDLSSAPILPPTLNRPFGLRTLDDHARKVKVNFAPSVRSASGAVLSPPSALPPPTVTTLSARVKYIMSRALTSVSKTSLNIGIGGRPGDRHSMVISFSDTDLPEGLDPWSQPLRGPLDALLKQYLVPASSRQSGQGEKRGLLLETGLIPSQLVNRARLEARYTTHPAVLDGVAGHLLDGLNKEVLPHFIEVAAGTNINYSTRKVRAIIGVVVLLAGFVIATMLVLTPSPWCTLFDLPAGSQFSVAARLATLPFWIAGIFYILSAMLRVCCLMTWKGMMEPMPYDEVVTQARGSSLASSGPDISDLEAGKSQNKAKWMIVQKATGVGIEGFSVEDMAVRQVYWRKAARLVAVTVLASSLVQVGLLVIPYIRV